MKVNANTLRSGNVIDYNGKLCAVVKVELIQPGKGAAVAQVELRDVRTGNKDCLLYTSPSPRDRG